MRENAGQGIINSDKQERAIVALIATKPLPPPASTLAAHFPALDGLRGVAILLMLFNMLNLFEPQSGVVAYVFGHITFVGWTGVQLFFVLSGFFITGILIDTQRARNYYSGFYARRALRIFPLYFGVLTVAFILLPAIGIVPSRIAMDQSSQIWLWTFLSNWPTVFGTGSHAFPHFWSLAVEAQFYLLWPLFIRSRSPEQCVRLCLSVAVISFVTRSILAFAGAGVEPIYENSLCRMDALALGGAAASGLRVTSWKDRLTAMHGKFLLWGIMLAIFGFVVTRFNYSTLLGETIGYTIVSLMFVLFLIAAAGADTAGSSGWVRALRFPPLRTLGKYSYAMYVFHKPLHDYAGRPLVAAMQLDVSKSVALAASYIVIGIVVTFAIAVVSWHLYEKHFLSLKRFFVPRQ